MFQASNLNKIDEISLLIFKRIFVIFLLFFLSFPIKSQNANKGIKKIVIDAGHGGKDSGTMGTKRYKKYEKHIALAVSLKLGDYIAKAFPNIEIIYTRESDVFLELRERTELANQSGADLFISVHCDGFTNSNASGASVFVMGMSKLKANMDVAMRENSVIYMEDNYQQKYEGFNPQSPESYIVFSLMQNTYLEQSISFAENIDDEFSNRAKRKSRGVKQAPFYVISRVNMPSVLIECGFLTNPEEEDYLNTKTGQDYIASAIFRAFRSYKQSIDLTLDHDDEKADVYNDDKVKKIVAEQQEQEVVIVFKVQIGTYLNNMQTNNRFKGLEVEEQVVNGTYKYFVGNTSSKNEADKLKEEMQEKGFNGAFVIALVNGIRVNIKEALSLQNNN